MADYTAMDAYRDIFRWRLRTGNANLMFNDSPTHATVLIAELLQCAQNDVWIFCRELGEDVWCTESVLAALDVAILNKVSFHVLVQKAPSETNRALVKLTNAKIEVKMSRCNSKANFVVADGRAYRFEEDSSVRKGFACANDATNATKLVEAFNNLSKNAIPLNMSSEELPE